MIKLKQVIHDATTNSVEATWVDATKHQIQIPDPEWIAPMIEDEKGNLVPDPQAVAPLIWTTEIREVQVRCHSYDDRQMDMLRADLGTDAAEHESLMAGVVANQKPILPPTAEQIASEARAKLREIDIASIRALREYVASQADAPQNVKDRESAAIAERGKLK